MLSLLLLSCANGLTISVDSSSNLLSANDNLLVDYIINLNNPELTNYHLILANENNSYVLFNSTSIVSLVNESITYPVSGVAAGVYNLSLVISNPSLSLTELVNHEISVLETLSFSVDAPSVIYATSDPTIVNALIINDGNTDLSISAYFSQASSDVSIAPQSFLLRMGENKTLVITIALPVNDYSTSLIVNSITNSETNEFPIRIIIPIINLSLDNIAVTDSTNESFVSALINNTGNMDLNATVIVRTFLLSEGFRSLYEPVSINAGGFVNYSLVLPKKSVISLSVIYGEDNTTITRELSFLGKIPFDFKLSQDRLLLIVILVVVILIIIYVKYFRKGKRP
jgi:hypothetical protein